MNLIIFFFSDQVMSRLASREPRRVGYFYFCKGLYLFELVLNDTNALVLDKVVKVFFFFNVNSEKLTCLDTLRECSSVRLIQVSLQLLTKKCLLCLGQTKLR